jgi:sodium-dependent phosphate cotransporter
VMVQSSSITTSLLVPLAGAGVITIHHAFPITVGANIGTTVTSLLAVMAVSGENAIFGLTIALVHLMFNLIGTAMILPFKAIREIPIILARKLAAVAVVSPKWAILYVMLLFYGLPAALAFIDKLLIR